MSSQRPDPISVVVIGAGYAGLIATNRFLGSLSADEQDRITVTVVNPRGVFVERIRLHQLAAGSCDTVTFPLAEVLHPDARTVVGRVVLIDPGARTVRISTPDGELDLAYDHLVYAVGSVAATQIPGAVQHSFPLGYYESALAAAEAITNAGDGARIAVVGGGFTGVEAASELAEQHPAADVTMVCAGELVPGMRPGARRSMSRTLRRLGVRVAEFAPVAEIEAGRLRLESGRVHDFDVCILAATFDVHGLAARSGLAVDDTGRLRVDEHLRCLDEPTVIGAGDAIVAPAEVSAHLRMGCAVAMPLGGQAAETLLATIRGAALPVLSVGPLVRCTGLGRKQSFRGRTGGAVMERICDLGTIAHLA